MKPNLLSQRTHDAITTSLWRQNDVAKSFWRRNDVISTRIRNCALSHVMASAQMLARICINSEEITVLITGAATQVITVFGQFGPAASPLWKKTHDKQCPFPWGSNYLHFVNYRWKAVPGKRSEWFVNLQHRISATGWLLFMRCVSFTFIRLLPTWTPTEIFDSFWAKHFSYCDLIICPIKQQIKVFESL